MLLNESLELQLHCKMTFDGVNLSDLKFLSSIELV